jgi:hypothetical protein
MEQNDQVCELQTAALGDRSTAQIGGSVRLVLDDGSSRSVAYCGPTPDAERRIRAADFCVGGSRAWMRMVQFCASAASAG